MALPPNVFTPVAQGLKKNVYPDNGVARLIVRSIYYCVDDRLKNHLDMILQSSRALQRALAPIWKEEEVSPTKTRVDADIPY